MTGEVSPQGEDPERKIARLEGELAEARRTAEERLTQLQYLQAEFDNYRKSLEKEKVLAIQRAREALVAGLLPVLDDLDQALPCLEGEKNREGFRLLSRKLRRFLEDTGLSPIESVGRPFDPRLHEAIAREESDRDDGIILEEFQKGYLLGSKVIRPSKVKIAENTKESREENHAEGKDHRN
ncbi:MAG TPA: nucleotide exchange factor GrpE [Methanomicrobiales archaeon]|nr:nucleotide exchange factor GrpE [Methanomicrobiales archaeon]